jgi:hypothetical protein
MNAIYSIPTTDASVQATIAKFQKVFLNLTFETYDHVPELPSPFDVENHLVTFGQSVGLGGTPTLFYTCCAGLLAANPMASYTEMVGAGFKVNAPNPV